MIRCLPYAIIEEHMDMTLKNICQRVIRAYTTSFTHDNLFEVSSKLDIPKTQQSYFVFDLTVTMSVADFYETYPNTSKYHLDAHE